MVREGYAQTYSLLTDWKNLDELDFLNDFASTSAIGMVALWSRLTVGFRVLSDAAVVDISLINCR
jgi:hypothetical protein